MRDIIAILFIASAAAAIISGAQAVRAAEGTFTVSLQTFGVDTTPPTVPTDLVATDVSDTQIDLSWTPSTDDTMVSGYRVFRDGAFLATTSIALYDDLGLSPATPYTYTVEAFDPSVNISGPSDPATATTTNTVIVTATSSPTVSSGLSAGGQVSPEIYAITVVPGTADATVSFETNELTNAQISWGTSPDYGDGSIAAVAYDAAHSFVIPGLSQGMTYYARIEATDAAGRSVFALVSFVTSGVAAPQAMPNPSDALAVAEPSDIRLSWTNPSDSRFIGVDIVRSDSFFPRDRFDGQLIYEGSGTSFIDISAVPGTTYYYAIFARGSDGSYSSGALVNARISVPGQPAASVSASSDPFASLPQAENVDPLIASLTLGDFDFIQDGRFLANDGSSTIAFDGGSDLTIRLPYGRLPEVLKTVAISVADPADHSKRFSFLLRANDDKTYYEATVGPIGPSGAYPIEVIVVDYAHQALKRIEGNLRALTFRTETLPPQGSGEPWALWALILAIICCLAAFWRLIVVPVRRRRRERALASANGTHNIS